MLKAFAEALFGAAVLGSGFDDAFAVLDAEVEGLRMPAWMVRGGQWR